jgi:hypothetical protein
MSEVPQATWLELFARDAAGASVTVPLRVLRRGGGPFLYLPARNQAAARALDLYPAQTLKARLAKAGLRLTFRFALLTHGGGTPFVLKREDPFLAYLARTAGGAAGSLPEFAVLAGNPQAPGRRFVFLLFDAAQNPVAVVKAGCSERARELIHHEAALLRECGSHRAGFPVLRDSFISGARAAFATDFIAGESPVGAGGAELENIFTSWLDQSGEILIREIPAWQRLVGAFGAEALPAPLAALGGTRLRPTLVHGDFAPWNVKAAKGRWTVLDWERGERVGIPGWDWFHFVVQPAVLVRREPPARTLQRLEELFAAAPFGRYARLAGIAGREWRLVAAYLTYCLRVGLQTEGVARLAALAQALQQRLAVTNS